MKRLILLLLLPLSLYMAYPYYTLYQINRAVADRDLAELSTMVDLFSIRHVIKRRMNKEAGEIIGEPSNNFITWLQDGISQMGSGAVDGLVNMEWVRQQLLVAKAPHPEVSFLSEISSAFFDAPDSFLVRIGQIGEEPTHFHLTFHNWKWRLTAIYN